MLKATIVGDPCPEASEAASADVTPVIANLFY